MVNAPEVPLKPPSWWDPDAATEFLALSVLDPPPAGQLRRVRVLVDLGGDATVTAYIHGL